LRKLLPIWSASGCDDNMGRMAARSLRDAGL
jgi:hypothetical protein